MRLSRCKEYKGPHLCSFRSGSEWCWCVLTSWDVLMFSLMFTFHPCLFPAANGFSIFRQNKCEIVYSFSLFSSCFFYQSVCDMMMALGFVHIRGDLYLWYSVFRVRARTTITDTSLTGGNLHTSAFSSSCGCEINWKPFVNCSFFIECVWMSGSSLPHTQTRSVTSVLRPDELSSPRKLPHRGRDHKEGWCPKKQATSCCVVEPAHHVGGGQDC